MKRALALCGGGSLGSYEIGVWKALKELGYHFDIVTGASIGAINGAMVAADRFEDALALWKTIDVSNVMKDGMNIDETFLSHLDLTKDSDYRKALKAYTKNAGADVAPLRELLEKEIAPLRVNRGQTKFGIVCCDFPSFKENDVVVNLLEDDEVVDYLLASASCWPIFPVFTDRHGHKLVDGGWINNLPIDFAFRLGADEVIAVLLNSVPAAQHPELFRLPNVTLIAPTSPQGSMLSFKQSAMMKNLDMGYRDAMKKCGPWFGFAFTFLPCDENADQRLAHKHMLAAISLDPYKAAKRSKALCDSSHRGVENTELNFFFLNLERRMKQQGFSLTDTYYVIDVLIGLKKSRTLREEKAIPSSQSPDLNFLDKVLDAMI